MASDGTTGQIPVASPVQGSQASSNLIKSGGKSLPQNGNIAAAEASSGKSDTARAALSNANKAPVQNTSDPASLVQQLNKYLNDSGRPDEFRLDPTNSKLIQQVNPASGTVIGQFSASEFPALARSLGGSGLLVDSLA